MRALAVAQAWQDRGGVVRVLFAQPNPPMALRLTSEGVDVTVLNCQRGSLEDAAEVVSEIRRASPAGVLVDGYDFGTEYLTRLQDGGRPVMLFDDYGQAPRLPVQVVVNQNLYAASSDYARSAAGARVLVGADYLTLRREYRAARPHRAIRRGDVGRIVVTLGGGDADNITGRVLDAINLLGPEDIEFVVLAGAQNPHLKALQCMVEMLGSNVRLETNRRDMPELLEACDIAVCGAGATCWEMAYMGVVTLPIVLAPNQERIAAAVDTNGIGRSLGWHYLLTAKAIAQAIRSLIDAPTMVAMMSSQALSLFDGHGAERVAKEIACLAVGEPISTGVST